MKLLVTGGAGFIGSNLVQKLVERKHKVIVIDNLCAGKKENLEEVISEIEFAEIDIRNKEEISSYFDSVSGVFHLAALKTVPLSLEKPEEYKDVNLNGTISILEASRENKVPKVIFSSSSSVYGDIPTLPKKESMELAPLSPYAATKRDTEKQMKLFSNSGLSTVSLRYFNVYGPKQDSNSEYAAVIPKFIKNCFKNEDCTIYGDGTQTRDFTYVSDVVNANIAAFESEKQFRGEPINIAGGKKITINELFETIAKSTNSKSKVVYKPEREGDIKHSLADVSLANTLLNWRAEIPLEKGIERTVEYFKAFYK